MKRRILLLLSDIVFVTFAFLLMAWLKPATKSQVLPQYFPSFLFFLVVWIVTSITTKKYTFEKYRSLKNIVAVIFISNTSVVAVIAVLMFLFERFSYSRLLVFGTVAVATIFEIIMSVVFNSVLTSTIVENGDTAAGPVDAKTDGSEVPQSAARQEKEEAHIPADIIDMVKQDYGSDVAALLTTYARQGFAPLKVVSTTTRFNIQTLSRNGYGMIVNLHRINDIKRINKFFETINEKMFFGGIFIGKAETYSMRKQRILKKFFYPLNYLIYIVDFIFKRIFPKVPGLKQIYFFVTRGKNRLLSRAETLGRLYSCGFKVVHEDYIGDELYFVVRKEHHPEFPKAPTYGPLIKLRRVGKNGRIFNVYKMRTMHPYAEYLQQYVFEKNELQEGGKFKDDFRVSTVGRLMRKVWLDELPMLINVLRGDMKIVGVRPLSQHYFNLYTEELQKKRICFKPGMIPPFYADMPVTLEEIMESEMRYLCEYEKNPLKTDIKYFFAAWRNIMLHKARSN